MIYGANRGYLESPIRIPLICPEMLDSHRASLVFPIAHICKPTAVADTPHVYQVHSEKIRGGYDLMGFADLGKKPQAPLLELAIEI